MTKPLMTQDEVATKRFNIIAPLTTGALEKGIRLDLMREIAKQNELSVRTIKRYLFAWEENGFEGLKPKVGWQRPDSAHGKGFDEVVAAAIELRREAPSRSIADIIKILELEGAIAEGAVKRSTLQRHMAAKGYAASQMRMYINKGAAARRYQKEHRCELWQGDIKFGPYIRGKDGKKHQIYLVVWIDDCTRFVVGARFYPHQKVSVIEDSLRRAIQKFGIPDKVLVDNGKQYRSKWLSEACAKTGIRLLTARPYRPETKGVVERFNRTVDKFISEAVMKKFETIDEYNEFLRIWIDEYYHKSNHYGLGGVSPETAFGIDTRPLRFIPAETLADAFLHTEKRKVDKSGCVSLDGTIYEVGVAYIGRQVKLRFDPSWKDEVEVQVDFGEMKPFMAKKLVIGPNCGVREELPDGMKTTEPTTSRMLDALKKKRAQSPETSDEIATTFKMYWEEGDVDV